MGKLQTLKQKISNKISDVRTSGKIRRYERSVRKAEEKRVKSEQRRVYLKVLNKAREKEIVAKAKRDARKDVNKPSKAVRAGKTFMAIGTFLGGGQVPVKRKQSSSRKGKGARITIDPKGKVTIYQKQKKKKKKKEKKRDVEGFFEELL